MPSRASAARASGIRPSPHALSAGGAAQSATVTRNPFRRTAIAAAKPAGPPPTTSTSVSRMIEVTLPPQQNKLRAEARTHGGKDAPGARIGTTLRHEFLEDAEHRRGRKIACFAQTLPRHIERAVGQRERFLRGLEHLGAARVDDPGSDVAASQFVL